MSVKMFVSPDILVSATHSKVVCVGWIHENGVQPHLLFTLLHHHQFAERLKKERKLTSQYSSTCFAYSLLED